MPINLVTMLQRLSWHDGQQHAKAQAGVPVSPQPTRIPRQRGRRCMCLTRNPMPWRAGIVFTVCCEPYLESEYGADYMSETPVKLLDRLLYGQRHHIDEEVRA